MIINPYNIELSSHIGLDLETNGLNPLINDILVIAITTSNETYVLDVSKYSQEKISSLLIRISKCKLVIAHNAKFDCSFIYSKYNILLRNVHCTMLASQILENYPTRVQHNLSAVLFRYCDKSLSTSSEKERLQKSFVGLKLGDNLSDKQLKYAGEDTKHLLDIYKSQIRRLSIDKLQTIMREENALLPVVVKMEVHGCLINKKPWLEEIRKWKAELKKIKKRLDDEVLNIVDEYDIKCGLIVEDKVFNLVDMFRNVLINYGSDKQIKALFKSIDIDPPTDNDSKESVSEDALKLYSNEHPKSRLKRFLEILLDYRQYNKLISTYGESFLNLLDSNNYIHTNYTQCRTKTGRLSSNSPNLQNIPGDDIGGKIREFFIPKKGCKMITCDMSGAEIAIAADYSKEKLLLDSLKHGDDMHSKLASISFSIIFGKPVVVSKSTEQFKIGEWVFIPNKLRKDNKSVTFAKFYKAGANRIYQVLAEYISKFHEPDDRLSVAKRISIALDKEMPQLTKYLSNKIKEGTTKGMLRGSKLGRIRYFDPTAYGQCANFPIQNTNAEAMKIALIKIDKYLELNGYGRIVMNIHDEVVVEVLENKAEEVAKEVKNIMASSLSYFLTEVEGGASVNINDYWEKD